MIKKINRHIPEKAYEFIKKTSFKNKEHLYIILDMINRITIYHKEETNYLNNFIDIPKDYFRDIVPNSTNLKDSFDYLKSNKIIECDGTYSVKQGKAYGYRIGDDFFSKLTTIQIEKSSLTKRIISNVNDEKNLVNDKYKVYKDFFIKNFKIDFKAALRYINQTYNTSLCGTISSQDLIKSITKYNHQYMAINAINDGELFFRHNKTNGRIDTNLTNLKSELKRFISIKGLSQIDITNSQPFILSLYLNTSLCGTKLSQDVSKYTLWTQKGMFYENFQKEYFNQRGKYLDRKQIKDIMFCIFYSKNDSYKKEKEIFKSIFPNVYSIIENEKKSNHSQLAIKMQKLESEICIDLICQELDKNNIKYFTIHDAWLVNKIDELKTKQIIENEFMKKYNSTPHLKIETITK